MPSSPSQGSQKSPKRSSPKRTPLQERSQSQTNELSTRRTQESKEDDGNLNVFSTTPFPTKPAHVLLPSTLRKQKNGQSAVPEFLLPSNSSSSSLGPKSPTSTGPRRPPVRLKRSVKTLRDLYEAQGEESRPSTATSARPSSAASSRLRSASSSEALSGRNAWDVLSKVSSDDLALLPSLAEGVATLKQIRSKSSFASRAAHNDPTSSPNYRILDVSSSPKIPVFKDLTSSDDVDLSEPIVSTPDTVVGSSSSPNVVRLGQTSSLDQLHNVEQSSSPNFVKLGTSSPLRNLPNVENSPLALRRSTSASSISSRKRKSAGLEDDRSKIARGSYDHQFSSSPPIEASGALSSETDPSSPPPQTDTFESQRSPSLDSDMVENSSPVIRLVRGGEVGFDGNSIAGTHASLQAALSSSPAPPIQYPVVRAPASSQVAGLSVSKRLSRSSHLSSVAQRWASRLSSVPSEASGNRSKDVSKASSYVEEDLDDLPDTASTYDGMYPPPESANNSQIRIITEDDQHEASDEVSALREGDYSYRSPNLRPVQNHSYPTSANNSQSRLNSLCTSIDNRLNSMKSFTQSRHDSLRSSTQRPLSSSSTTSVLAVPIPTWARRYYSGFYNDTFQHLYTSNSTVVLNPNAIPHPRPQTSTSRQSHPSFVSLKDTLAEHIPTIFRPKTRPRLEARKSHTLPGLGPLVSNPVRGPATSAMIGHLRSQPDHRPSIRPVSLPLHPADPRAHWAGIVEIPEKSHSGHLSRHTRSASVDNNIGNDRSLHARTPWNPRQPARSNRIPSDSPHLHHDHRLNTGSSASRGYGFPFNRKSRWSAPDLSMFVFDGRRSKAEDPFNNTNAVIRARRLRIAQITCFISGFIIPLTWLVGAILPLPNRPSSFADVEKASYAANNARHAEDMLSKLRAERHARGLEEMEWQNTRWWRTLNRYMCSIGLLVLVAIIILAVLGTRRNW